MTQKLKSLLLAAAACSALAGCDSIVDSPSWTNQARVEVHDDQFHDSFNVAEIDDNIVRAIGTSYYRYGNGPMTLTMVYDQKSGSETRASAKREAQKLINSLRVHGVQDVTVAESAVANMGPGLQVDVSFPALIAKAPEACKSMMPGYGTQTSVPDNATDVPDYKYGCSVESMLAQQVARPGDLLGRPGHETYADGRRQEVVVNRRGYYENKSNEPLQGTGASED